VLASHLSDPNYYTKCDPQHCDPELRYQKIIQKLQLYISKHYIICLQEVTSLWKKKLSTFFQEMDYQLVHTSDSNRVMENLGVAIAFPQQMFVLERYSIDIVSETKTWSNSDVLPWYERWKVWASSQLGYTMELDMDQDYHIARSRVNPQIMVELRVKKSDTRFAVASYHMPCLWKRPRTMVIHAGLSCQLAQRFAGDIPLIYCGDFNSTPDSAVYQLLTKGILDSSSPHHPKRSMPSDDFWTPDVQPMASAYQMLLNQEPSFTNYAQTLFDSVPFSAVLDYIFCSEHWEVESVVDLPTSVDKYSTLLPNDEEPSDHLMIGSLLRLKNSRKRSLLLTSSNKNKSSKTIHTLGSQ
jgi:mRNA deadenylase 3'-5' endonuclease subunit Ccr4